MNEYDHPRPWLCEAADCPGHRTTLEDDRCPVPVVPAEDPPTGRWVTEDGQLRYVPPGDPEDEALYYLEDDRALPFRHEVRPAAWAALVALVEAQAPTLPTAEAVWREVSRKHGYLELWRNSHPREIAQAHLDAVAALTTGGQSDATG